jgi:hypothetical protein
MKDDNFDLILAIPCKSIKTDRKQAKIAASIEPDSLSSLSDDSLKCYLRDEDGQNIKDGKGNDIVEDMVIKNALGKSRENLREGAETFCEEIEKHSEYELVYNDESNKLEIKRKPLLYGQVILYKDDINIDNYPECCYNFFSVVSELSVRSEASSENNEVYNIYVVVPDMTYYDLTLMMDQSHDLWCNIKGNLDGQVSFTDYLETIGYKYLGKIYRIIFSDLNQFNVITKDDKTKLFNILATEVIKDKAGYSHQIELSENSNDYVFSCKGEPDKDISLIKKEKFFDDYNMYSSYRAFASIYSYYYIIKEQDKDTFYKRIMPDKNNGDFSSEANILFVLETEIFKIGACLLASDQINQQININDMVEVQKMFKHFINMRPLFEKLNYRYLGAQKESDFIYKQFRIGDILSDYDHKRELLKSYCEVSTSIKSHTNSKILNCIGLLFAFIAGWDRLSFLSKILFDNERTIQWGENYYIPIFVSVIIIGIVLGNINPLRRIKKLFKNRSWFLMKPKTKKEKRL